MSLARFGIIGVVMRFAAKLRFPNLFMLFATLLVANIMIPDPVPFADELLLGLGTLLFARWRKKPEEIEHEKTQPEEAQDEKIPD